MNGFSMYDKVIDLLEEGLTEEQVAERLHITLEEVKSREQEFLNEIKAELGLPDDTDVKLIED
jgi:DNA-directed RNA polymerase specialized sigma24 family protein